MLGFNDFQLSFLLDLNLLLILVFIMSIIITFFFKNTSFLVDSYFKEKELSWPLHHGDGAFSSRG
jgi:hypothetical protein